MKILKLSLAASFMCAALLPSVAFAAISTQPTRELAQAKTDTSKPTGTPASDTPKGTQKPGEKPTQQVETIIENPTIFDNIPQVVAYGIKMAFTVAGTLAFLVILVGGFKILTSQGDPKKKEEGKRAVLYAVIGLAVIFGSYSIIAITTNLIGLK